MIIEAPGIYDMPEDSYHRDPVPGGSLSVSGAKKLLPPSCPAIYAWEREHPKAPTKSMELGTVVHGLVLGTGQPVAVIDADDWRTKAAKEARELAIATGNVPMLTRDYERAVAIADAVKQHETAGGLLADGDAEQSMFWRDGEFGIWKRGRLDWLTYFGGQPVIADVKTAESAAPDEFARSAARYDYEMQDPYYRDGLAAILGCDPGDIDFVFAVVPTVPPYLPMIYRLKPEHVALGRERNRDASEIYRDCTEAGIWPAWSEDITELSLPHWKVREIESGINDYND